MQQVPTTEERPTESRWCVQHTLIRRRGALQVQQSKQSGDASAGELPPVPWLLQLKSSQSFGSCKQDEPRARQTQHTTPWRTVLSMKKSSCKHNSQQGRHCRGAVKTAKRMTNARHSPAARVLGGQTMPGLKQYPHCITAVRPPLHTDTLARQQTRPDVAQPTFVPRPRTYPATQCVTDNGTRCHHHRRRHTHTHARTHAHTLTGPRPKT